MKKYFFESFKNYRFEFKHLTVFFFVLLIFQMGISFVNKVSVNKFLTKTQEWYKRDSAERFANITTTSLELIVETVKPVDVLQPEEKRKIIRAFNIVLSQQIPQQNVREISLLVSDGKKIYSIKDGDVLYSYLYDNQWPLPLSTNGINNETIKLYKNFKNEVFATERIKSVLVDNSTFYIFVPFIPRGEYVGILYMKYAPDLTQITKEIAAGYDEMGIIYSSLIIFGLLGMYYVSSYTLKERDKVQQKLLEEHESRVKEKVIHENEAMFTKRIYHTHHKAEKIMGFIKEDIMQLPADTLDEIKYRIMKYAHFVSRVIYDMKWYEPTIQTIRNPLFQTNLNELVRFITKNIFLRAKSTIEIVKFNLELDEKLPCLQINEYVIWEIIEPLIQNSIDHACVNNLIITIKTEYFSDTSSARIIIQDNGAGIKKELLEEDSSGIKKAFLENTSTKSERGRNSGYGCYLAYTMAKERCGWQLDAQNIDGGCQFIITLQI
ncbi:MAG: histidine kinase [Ignavibacteria bacterium RIFOXYB2_FULL_35_12]|nr:MAG: histidine kinase [Ignavibacteria bacterium GWA2_36_19]OGU53240.1 MAG: histidine kinase [Ignavibacteria bacterium GWC2_35_8]OGU61178.1 MAG: histidine kinase [Ignavibacteria bacterium GWF2_35_20]OGU88700.1 MAG: histidine kinase [Ignavibacteria bacterium RIFOXYA12_FULL_35_25]OGU89170.1 MAG: histidine kinase [Ignavibacteria bacterium RIFOXYC12_FULL_35_11]OGU94379.1 MAG: histidine kinase [Ignavibacteria bacterium RIFOXYB12_FULL_35_14]OGU99759.1 MAG: histidine kinase [Ignavibacteria bacteri